MTGQPIMLSFDVLTYTCARGYSTDGTINRESREFDLECLAPGYWSRTLKKESECQPVVCDNFQLTPVPFTHITSEVGKVYTYGEHVAFKCYTGYTLTGEVDGPKTFDIACRANGKFEAVKKTCKRIRCDRPNRMENAIMAKLGWRFYYADTVNHECIAGYTLDGTVSGAVAYVGTCGADGAVTYAAGEMTISTTESPPCQPVTCLVPKSLDCASINFMKGDSTTSREYGSSALEVECNYGCTVGGVPAGDTTFQITCGTDGEFSGLQKCMKSTISVSGEVTDVTSADLKLSEVKVEFKSGGVVMDTAYTNSMGQFTVSVAEAVYEVEYSLTGYVTEVKQVEVMGPIQVGQGADGALTEVLPAGTWRAVVEWGKHSEDIDSHSYFGDGQTTHVYWPGWDRVKTAPGTNGITVELDRDDVTSYGPETTTFTGVGDCTTRGKCLITFKIKNYTPEDGDLGASAVKIKLYKGGSGTENYEIPKSVGADLWYTVFTIDARTEKVYNGPGEFHEAPYLADWKETNWYQCMDWDSWCHTPSDTLLIGFYRTAIGGLSKISKSSSMKVEMASKITCKEKDVDFSGKDGKWATCPPGQYLNGLHRGGNRYDQKEGAAQLTGISCCKVEGLPEEWGTCSEFPVDDAGWSTCTPVDENGQVTTDNPLVMTGVHRNTGDEASRLDSVKCCALPVQGLMPGAPPAPIETDWEAYQVEYTVSHESSTYSYESYDFYGSYGTYYY